MEKLRRLGRSDIEISPIGLGCWQFSAGVGLVGGFWEALPPPLVEEIIDASLQGGINWFDTAEAYGNGRSEQALAAALTRLGKKPGDVVVATKWLPIARLASSIGATIGERLSALSPFGIDLHQIHQPYAFATVDAQAEQMAKLVQEGKIRTVGVSNFSEKKMRATHAALARRGVPLVSNQMQYSLLDRRIESNGVLAAAKELGITIIAYSPLAQGLLSGKFHDDPSLIKSRVGPRKFLPNFRLKGMEQSRPLIEELKKIATAHGATPSQVALNWLCAFHGDTVVAIPGATKRRHAEENVGTMGFTLSADELRRIDELSQRYR
ncbi:oxidoreductase, aldo reductase [Cystobacter fuscus DSM 2262]|uniref:Oxidoreductase, aldo reductase n=1 Tax=Cystobacter fuscus (strain ATCC 25194 / DSM 2262 / NBRC 100088 / M29) TaxID=1242864 RepID=S9Q424_CYSF2|nr:aldo/keto reductase [Cystobacter fuscus]EPX56054.1 oxidoreductase, aldo reductase [Cystobacter fuscus DSM 2262]